MKNIIWGLLLTGITLFAVTGEEVYQTNCVSCHAMQGKMNPQERASMHEKMQTATPQERKAMKQKMMKKMHNSDKKAPDMPMVSLRLKKMLDNDRKKFIDFVDDYIQNPSQDKGYCMPMAYQRFGVMPPIGLGMSEAERHAVATWLYDDFKGSWDSSEDAQMCGKQNHGAKKGKGKKCGGSKNTKSMKCGAGKCGK